MSYSDRKNVLSKRDLAKANSKWAAQRPRADKAKVSQQQRNLWERVHAFVRQNGGSITLPPYHSPIRLEVEPLSGLPAVQADSFDVIFLCHESRLGAPVKESPLWGRRNKQNPGAYGFHQVAVYEVRLPK
jgi:hypothetical protein